MSTESSANQPFTSFLLTTAAMWMHARAISQGGYIRQTSHLYREGGGGGGGEERESVCDCREGGREGGRGDCREGGGEGEGREQRRGERETA